MLVSWIPETVVAQSELAFNCEIVNINKYKITRYR